ncbi:MAG: response regulator transcription factor [Nitrospirota bacterium]
MNILINLSSHLISEALSDLLKKEQDGYQIFVVSNRNTFDKLSADNFSPDVILVDFNNINPKLFSRYPESKVILIDTGLKQEDIIATLLSYKLSGVLSAHTDLHLFKKALKIVSEGEIWIDNSIIKAFLHSAGLISKTGKINGITGREKEIIEYISQGYRNKEIAQRLNISEQTVKAHLNRIFRKFNVSNRSKLITLAMNNRIA